MIKFIIYEDNPDSIERIVSIIHRSMASYDLEYKIEKYNSYTKEIEKVITEQDSQRIYILDIEVPIKSGLEVASLIREKDWKSIIIFITSHPECKNDVFHSRLLALDYISKYNNYDNRLQKSIETSLKILNKQRILTYKYNYILYRVSFDEIIYIKKQNNFKKNYIYIENGEPLEIPGTIKEIKSQLDNEFCLSSQSCIVNLTKIDKIDITKNTIIFKNIKNTEKISNNYKKNLIEQFNKYR